MKHVCLKLLVLVFILLISSRFIFTAHAASTKNPDINGDSSIDILDIGIIINNFLKSPISVLQADLNGDGVVDNNDIGIVVSNYGKPPPTVSPSPSTSWENGSVRYLPLIQDSFVTYVSGLSHGKANAFTPLSATQDTNFQSFFSSLVSAASSTPTNSSTNWCSVQTKAALAGYTVSRFYDTDTGRYFIYANDSSGHGQGYFFLNPEPKRDIVIESPHTGYETNTDSEGARVFLNLSAKGYLINGDDRCSSSLVAECGGSSAACGADTASDVPHDTRNTFNKAHIVLSSLSAITKFVQLHGMVGSSSDIIEAADGSTNDVDSSSDSVLFAQALRKTVPNPSAVYSCQEAGTTPSGLCATENVQGRYTNNPSGSTCTTSTSSSSHRFLHVEQTLSLRDNNSSDGLSWQNVYNALLNTWPACNLGSSASDCSLGTPQVITPTCVCGSTCP